jgi:hypothetical protein
VQAAGDRLRLVVNLHDVAARRQVWSEQFTGTRAELFTLQDAIYDGIVSALGVAGGDNPAARTAAHPTDDIEAYDLYLKGRDSLRTRRRTAEADGGDRLLPTGHSQGRQFCAGVCGAGRCEPTDVPRHEGYALGRTCPRRGAARARSGRSDALRSSTRLARCTRRAARAPRRFVVAEARARALAAFRRSDTAARRGVPGAGQQDEAIGNLRKAVEVNPYFWVNHNVLGDAYLRFGDTRRASRSSGA